MSSEEAGKSTSAINRRAVLQGAAMAVTAAAASGSTSQKSLAAAPHKPVTAPSANKLMARAVNFSPIQNDNRASAAKIKADIETSARDGINFIVFPEMALQGFHKCQDCADHGSACAKHLATGERADGPIMRELAEVAKRHDMYAVVGFGERDPVKPHVYNAAAMFGPEGLIGVTRKLGVGAGSKQGHSQSMFSPGEDITVFPTRYGPVGVGICFDVWMNPEVSRVMVLKGAKIVVIPTATVATTRAGDIEQMAFTRARENVVFVINANCVRGGFDGHIKEEPKYHSHSYIAGPQFPSMARIIGKSDDPFGYVTAEIDLAHYDKFNALDIRNRRAAAGTDSNISRAIAREYAGYIGKTVA